MYTNETSKKLIYNPFSVSYLTTRNVLTSPAAVDQIPGGQQNYLQAGPSQDFFATAVQKLPKDFLI